MQNKPWTSMMFWWTPTFVVFGPNINDPSGIYLGAKCGSLKDFQGMHIPRGNRHPSNHGAIKSIAMHFCLKIRKQVHSRHGTPDMADRTGCPFTCSPRVFTTASARTWAGKGCCLSRDCSDQMGSPNLLDLPGLDQKADRIPEDQKHKNAPN